MIILLHVLIALSSVALASYTFFKPSNKKLYTSYGLMVATVASGTMLILLTNASILHACLSGLLYVTATLITTIATHVRMRSSEAVTIHSEDK